MSFAGAVDVMNVVEGIVKRMWKDKRPKRTANLSRIAKITYDTAMRTYGSDKPDLRFSESRVRCL